MQSTFLAPLVMLALLPAVVQAAPTDSAAANLPITHVNLYTSGVGYFERTGTVDGDASQTILFPVDQVNDVLKSLVLLDSGGGSILPVTYGAQDPISKQLEAFSVNIGDNPSQADLLSRLRGAPVSVTVSKSVITGTIVSVETKTVTLPNNQGTTTISTLNLLGDNGSLQAIPLDDNVSSINILDDKLKAELAQEMQVVAQGRDLSKRPLTLKFAGHGRRNILVGYVAQAPLWQTSYRLVLGKSPLLQGWANVQNTSQDDWNNIHLTLVSGRPVSFIQDLYTPIYIDRPTVAPRIANAPGPQTYYSNIAANEPVPMAPAAGGAIYHGRGETKDDLVPNGAKQIYALQSDNSLLVLGTPDGFQTVDNLAKGVAIRGAQLGTALFSYDIRVTVTVPRQQSAMIPFVQTSVLADPVSIYNESTLADHPMAGVRLKNTSGLHLMGCPLTVFDQTSDSAGYVGDALIDDTEPGQTRLLSYAVDLAIDASSNDDTTTGEVTTITMDNGYLRVTRRYEEDKVYTFKNHANKERLIVVEHPTNGSNWKLLEPAKPTETTADLYRFDVPIKAGESLKFKVRQSYPQLETDALIDSDLPTLVVYSQNGQESPKVRAALLEVITRRRSLAATQARIDSLQAQSSKISSGQDRIRENMKALSQNSALYQRYVGELDAQETQLETINSQLNDLNNQLANQQTDLASYISHLDLS